MRTVDRPYLLMDETPVQVLNEPGKAPESKSQLWALMSAGPEPPIVVFEYDPTRSGEVFAGHDEGAAAWGCIASHIETCKMNGVEPYAWLKSTLEKIAAGHPQSRLPELLPWNFDPASS